MACHGDFQMNKIYTRGGDKGKTALVGGRRVSKQEAKIMAYGDVDELNAVLAHWHDQLVLEIGQKELACHSEGVGAVVLRLKDLSHELFDLGSELATPEELLDKYKIPLVNEASYQKLEADIDKLTQDLEPLKNFILPMGHPLISLGHMLRTVVRRTERSVVSLNLSQAQRPETLIFLNRLSDWVFVAARVVAKYLGVPEVEWLQKQHRS